MAERWAIIEVTVQFDDDIDDIDALMTKIVEAVAETTCPHPQTWGTSAPDVQVDDCRQMVIGSHLVVSPPEKSEHECPFCGANI